jgi:hypothetical protein
MPSSGLPCVGRTIGACGTCWPLALPRTVQWGIGRIETFNNRRFYQPAPDGRVFALIVPMVEFGDTIDLCAVMLPERHVATRLGIGAALGLDVIDWARWHERTLHLVEDPLRWLRSPARCAFIVDWTRAAVVLADLGHIRCTSLALGERVERAFRQPLPVPLVQVRP